MPKLVIFLQGRGYDSIGETCLSCRLLHHHTKSAEDAKDLYSELLSFMQLCAHEGTNVSKQSKAVMLALVSSLWEGMQATG